MEEKFDGVLEIAKIIRTMRSDIDFYLENMINVQSLIKQQEFVFNSNLENIETVNISPIKSFLDVSNEKSTQNTAVEKKEITSNSAENEIKTNENIINISTNSINNKDSLLLTLLKNEQNKMNPKNSNYILSNDEIIALKESFDKEFKDDYILNTDEIIWIDSNDVCNNSKNLSFDIDDQKTKLFMENLKRK